MNGYIMYAKGTYCYRPTHQVHPIKRKELPPLEVPKGTSM